MIGEPAQSTKSSIPFDIMLRLRSPAHGKPAFVIDVECRFVWKSADILNRLKEG